MKEMSNDKNYFMEYRISKIGKRNIIFLIIELFLIVISGFVSGYIVGINESIYNLHSEILGVMLILSVIGGNFMWTFFGGLMCYESHTSKK